MAVAANSWVLDLTVTLPTTPQRVFRLLTDPPAVARWWGPDGFTTPELEIDLRLGGRYRFGMQPPEGELFQLSGEFVEVDAPRRLAYTFIWEEPDPDDQETLVELSLDPLDDGGTRLSLRQATFTTEARLALHRSGWTDAFQKLHFAATSGDE